MVNEGMLLFLSKGSISEHIEYMYKIKAEISIIEKSLPGICAKSFAEIMKSKIDFECKKELKEKYTDYLSHKLYFDSFALNDRPCPEIKRYYSSEDSFCYEMLEKSKSARGGFMYVTKEKRIRFEGKTLSMDSLLIRLAQLRRSPQGNKFKFYLRADKDLRYGDVIEVLKTIKKSGHGSISLVTETEQ